MRSLKDYKVMDEGFPAKSFRTWAGAFLAKKFLDCGWLTS